MKIPSSDPESAQSNRAQMIIWFMSFRGGDPTLSWCSKLILPVAWAYRSAMKISGPDSESPQKKPV